MDFMEVELDEEALEAASNQINYFNNIPKHIRGIVAKLNEAEPYVPTSDQEAGYSFNPATVIEGLITVKNGVLNIPTVA